MTKQDIDQIVLTALREDKYRRDITTQLTVPARHASQARIIAKEDSTVCGLAVVQTVFRKIDSSVCVHLRSRDGSTAKKGTVVAEIHGKTRAILTGERTALNFLSHLSGITTLTRRYVQAVRPYRTHILDTRKTTPGLRLLEKWAVRCGGGENHRMDLSEMVMVKDNHLLVDRQKTSLAETVRRVRTRTRKKLIVEVDDLNQFQKILKTAADIILLDNFSVGKIKKAVILKKKFKSPALLEASGGITLKNVRQIAATGIDRISVGALTHSAAHMDFSLELT